MREVLVMDRPARLPHISLATTDIAKLGRVAYSMKEVISSRIGHLLRVVSGTLREIYAIKCGTSETSVIPARKAARRKKKLPSGPRIDHSTPPSLSSPQSVSGISRL